MLARPSANLLVNPAMIKAANGLTKGWELLALGSGTSLEDATSPLPATTAAVQGSSSFDVLESTAILSTCCDVRPLALGGAFVATSSLGLMREQEVDLIACGFDESYLDTVQPRIFVSERFAQVPPGERDEAFLRVELRDKQHEVIAEWQPGEVSQRASPTRCSSSCELSRVDGTPFWTMMSHNFTNYGSGVRYVHWRDGGRDGEAYTGHVGTLMDAPTLTVDLLPASGCAKDCGDHGACAGGVCACERGWQGEYCDVSTVACPLHCSDYGTCQLVGEVPRCRCHDEFTGSYCTIRTTARAGQSKCVDGSDGATRKGIDLALTSSTTVGLRSGVVHVAGDLAQIPVISDGVVLPDWGGMHTAPATLQGNTSEKLRFHLSVTTHIPAMLGEPAITAERPSIVSYSVKHRDSSKALSQGQPRTIEVNVNCIRPGVSRIAVAIPVPGFCTLAFSFIKTCTQDGVTSGGGGALWLLILVGVPVLFCCCLGPRRRSAVSAWLADGCGYCAIPPLQGLYPVREGEHQGLGGISRASLTYGAYGLWSRIRMAKDELLAGQLRLSDLPVRLSGSPRTAGLQPLPEHDDMQEML